MELTQRVRRSDANISREIRISRGRRIDAEIPTGSYVDGGFCSGTGSKIINLQRVHADSGSGAISNQPNGIPSASIGGSGRYV